MPKKTDNNREHIDMALHHLQQLKQPNESYRDIFVRVMGRQPKDQSEINTFTNRFKRGNPGSDFIGRVAEAYPEIRDMTIGEFLGIKKA
ncbi:hypothetical protein [Pseudoalteromonas galatheae]|uniref:hypothetical protein n=1 Tax=Pseudoalteromonas galatheae TaxID=579562 RepID=UPI0030CE9CD4